MNRSLFFFLERISGKEMLRKAVWAVVGNQKNKVFGQVVARLEQHNKKVFQVDPRDSSGALPTNLSQVLFRLRSLRKVYVCLFSVAFWGWLFVSLSATFEFGRVHCPGSFLRKLTSSTSW